MHAANEAREKEQGAFSFAENACVTLTDMSESCEILVDQAIVIEKRTKSDERISL